MNEIIKKRTLKANTMVCLGCEDNLLKMLSESRGVRKAAIERNNKVKINYNLLEINYKEIEKKLNEAGYHASENVLDKLKRGWINFTEENEYKNITNNTNHCCSVTDEQMDHNHKRYDGL